MKTDLLEADLIKLYSEAKPKLLLICSYTLDLTFLEYNLLSKFRRYYDTKIAIITSELGIHESFNEGRAVRGAGTEYYIYHVAHKYPFHPKIFLYIDNSNCLKAYISGANFTLPGMCLNMDSIEFVDFNSASLSSINSLSIFLETLDRKIASRNFSSFLDPFYKKLGEAEPQQLHNTEFLSNVKTSIADHIIRKSYPIKKLRIISPYYDHNLKALSQIVNSLGNPPTEILLNKADSSFNIKALPKGISVYVTSDRNRYLHTKLYILYSGGSAVTVSGSANCTVPGLFSDCYNGNWETAVLRSGVPQGHADSLWESFRPKALNKKDYWTYQAPKKDTFSSSSLQFTAALSYRRLAISLLNGLFNGTKKVSVSITTLSGTSYFRQITADMNKSNELEIILTAEETHEVQKGPAQLELEVDKLHGAAWINQTHLLSKSSQIKKFENAVHAFRRDADEGWEQLSDLMNFIYENFNFIGVSRQENEKNYSYVLEKQSRSKNQIPTINGIYDVDDEIPLNKLNAKVGDILELGNVIKDLIDKGIDLSEENNDEDDDDDFEDEESEGYKPAKRNNTYKKPKSSSAILTVQDSNNEKRKRRIDIIDSIPFLNSLFKEAIFSPFNSFLSKPNNDSQLIRMKFEALCSMVLFSLKLVRFLRLELSLRFVPQNRQNIIDNYFAETSLLIKEFKSTTNQLIILQKISKQELSNLLLDSELLWEILLTLTEMWHFNFDEIFGRRFLIDLIKNLTSGLEEDFILNSISGFINEKERFNPSRSSLLIETPEVNGILKDIFDYESKDSTVGNLIRKHIKYQYWKEANEFHCGAIITLKEKNSDNHKLIQNHIIREDISRHNINRLKEIGETELENFYDSRLYDIKCFYGINEIKNDEHRFFCPCNCELDADVFIKLKKFEYVTCQECGALFIPAVKFPEYKSRESDDSEWVRL